MVEDLHSLRLPLTAFAEGQNAELDFCEAKRLRERKLTTPQSLRDSSPDKGSR